MIALLQRVAEARVTVQGNVTGEIGQGLLTLLCAEPEDTEKEAERLVDRILSYRVFADDAGKMNLSLMQMRGGLLLVPQFTLAADTRSGNRPGFSGAAPPDLGRRMFDHALGYARTRLPSTGAGIFGADMKVALVNDGPVTFWLSVGRRG
ncbi:MAG: D-tyrosyl-tRNA(Tyr) deacylase [Betaproteobacteria bacterium]|nr:D-tyrosyl-tRNA(Tyr) deacylase [Betaproteobacteria bacterium]